MNMKQPDLIDAILGLYRDDINWCDAQGSVSWKDGHQTTQQESQAIQAELARLQADYEAKQYQRDRANAYPSLQEQLDMQYWDSVNGTTVWQDTINAIKAKYPKVG
jgi:hypothetical protein